MCNCVFSKRNNIAGFNGVFQSVYANATTSNDNGINDGYGC